MSAMLHQALMASYAQSGGGGGGGGDPFYSNVSLLLHFDGVNGSTSFPDVVGTTWNTTGNPVVSTAQSRFGGASGLFNGAGDGLVAASNLVGHQIQDVDFTIEAFINLDTNATGSNQVIIGKAQSGDQSYFLFLPPTRDYLIFAYSTNGSVSGNVAVYGAFAFQPGVWYHVAVSRQGTELRLFVDGVQVGATATVPTTWFNSSQAATIGWINVGGFNYWFRGWIDEVRITKGTARYTANFTPPNAPFPDQ